MNKFIFYNNICYVCSNIYIVFKLIFIILLFLFELQDKMDDVIIGIKSTALKFGDKSKIYLSGFSTVMITGLIASGILAAQTWPYYTAVGLVGTHLVNQVCHNYHIIFKYHIL